MTIIYNTIHDYNETLLRARKKNLLDDQVEQDDERRSHPRFRANRISVQIAFDVDTYITDFSAGGISLRSSTALRKGLRIQIAVAECFSVPAIVLRSTEIPQADNRYRYLVHCRFQDDFLGRFVVVWFLNQQLI